MNIDEKIKERKSNYGDYTGASELRSNIMELLNKRRSNTSGKLFTPLEEIMILDIVNKLTRIAATPDHLDSWEDMEGYSRRIKEHYQEVEKHAKKSTLTGHKVTSNTPLGESPINKVPRTFKCDKGQTHSCTSEERSVKLCCTLWPCNMGTRATK